MGFVRFIVMVSFVSRIECMLFEVDVAPKPHCPTIRALLKVSPHRYSPDVLNIIGDVAISRLRFAK